MSSSTKIVAEYTKSGKSSCTKCSEKIESKSLRLGLKSQDDSIKWHHFTCFFSSDSTQVYSAETIEGFSELKVRDQYMLKQMVSEGAQCSTKRGDEEIESDKRDLKKLKSDDQEKLKELVIEGDPSSKKREGEDETKPHKRNLKKLKTNEDENVGQEKKNATNEKIVVGYAKSQKSSCKKCSEKIESKSLRLGLSYWHPRGFQNTKWHHVDCFFSLDAVLVSPESIEGFSQLKSYDQERLKKLVIEGDQSSKKREGDNETESDERDLKKLKTDEDEKDGQEKMNVTNEKIVVGYAKSGKSSCKNCFEKIESKSLRLGLSYWHPRGFQNTKWYHLNCFFPLDAVLVSPELIEGFSELKSDDQERLKKLVIEGDHSSKKRDVETELDKRDSKKLKKEGDDEIKLDKRDLKTLKADEDEKDVQEKKNVRNEKIVAEYAKSGKSSCKKCSEKIEPKSLRLGLSYWHPRGFQNTKWHHLDCFFPLDAALDSPESIEGFSKLKSDDQEKLKKLVIEGDQSSKKREGDEEIELDKRDLKKLKTDEDEKAEQEKQNVRNEKIVAEYAKSGKSSCKKCSKMIESKSLRLGLSYWHPRGFQNTKWHHLDCFFPLDAIQILPESIEGFSELKNDDQQKLKKLVTEGDQFYKKREGDEETESDKSDLKKLKTDEDEKAGQEKKIVANEKIVAEYAKSGKSSCKKCSEKIECKSLRLGLSYWHPRGFQNTKWHHLDCFFSLDAALVSPESIERFSELKSDDQEKLKKLIKKS